MNKEEIVYVVRYFPITGGNEDSRAIGYELERFASRQDAETLARDLITVVPGQIVLSELKIVTEESVIKIGVVDVP